MEVSLKIEWKLQRHAKCSTAFHDKLQPQT